MYINHHVHTHHSVFDSILKPEELISVEKSMGHDTVCISNHGTMSGVVETYKLAKKNNMKLIICNEMYLVDNVNVKNNDYWHIMMVAKNNEGYKNLMKLTTASHANFYNKPRIDWKMLNEMDTTGIICTTACLGGVLKRADADNCLHRLQKIFKEDSWVEIHTFQTDEQKRHHRKIFPLIREYGLKIIPAVDAHYATKSDAKVHRIWKELDGKETDYFPTDDLYLHTWEDICRELDYLCEEGLTTRDELYNGLQDFGKVCNVEIPLGEKHYPHFNADNKTEMVKDICRNAWRKHGYGNNKERLGRFLYEMDALEKMDYIDYFLIMYDVINKCKELGIPTGKGRGSVGGSFVAYLMGITGIDPIQYNMMFERFAHLERISPPDIDTDVGQERRKEIIKYIEDKYGIVHQVRTYNTLGEAGAVQRAGQCLKLPPASINALTKGMLNIESLPATTKLLDDDDYNKLKQIAIRFRGLISNFGVHASGVVVFPEEAENWTPLERQKDSATKEEHLVCGYEFKDLEELGLLKLDILGLRTLDVINDTIKLIGHDVNFITDDAKTFAELNKSPVGIFQLETSSGMRDLINKLKPKKFEDLVPLIALYRPGPLNSGMVDKYVKRKNEGWKPTSGLMGDIEKTCLKDTYGVLIYQEQIMQIARDFFGYSLGEADMLRRAIGKKDADSMAKILADIKERCPHYNSDELQKILDWISEFAQYSFNYSHSVTYGYIAFQTAFLKANYPKEFFTSVLNSSIGNRAKTVRYVEEARRFGIDIIMPHHMFVSEQFPCDKWSIVDNSILVGYTCASGIGQPIDIGSALSPTDLFLNGVPAAKLEPLCKTAFFNDISRDMCEFTVIKTFGPKLKSALGKIEEWIKKKNDKKVQEWIEKCEQIYIEAAKIPYPKYNEYHVTKNQMEIYGFSYKNIMEFYDTNRDHLIPIGKGRILSGYIVDIKKKAKKGKKGTSIVLAQTTVGLREFLYYGDHTMKKDEAYTFQLDGNKILDYKTCILKKGVV